MDISHEFPRMGVEAQERVRSALAKPCDGYLCDCPTATLRRRNARGTVTVHLQCDGCGRSLGGAMRRAEHYLWQSYAEWDDRLQSAHSERIERERYRSIDAFQAMMADRHARSDAEAAERREEYRTLFLRSPEWRALAGRVMARADNLCEACLARPASDVHHLTYDLGRLPPAWELRAVCRACHDRLHAWTRTDAGA